MRDDPNSPVAVVTGATRGIGRHIALDLARNDLTVVVVGRTSSAADGAPLPGSVDETVGEIEASGGRAIGIAADLSDEAATQAIVDGTLDAFGRCDLLVNNAAFTSNGPMMEIPWRRWQRALRVNVVAPHQLGHGFVPGMLERGGGRVVNVSTGASQAVSSGLGLYSASKLAMERWADYLHVELGGRIAVNSLRVDRIVATEGWLHIARTDGLDLATAGNHDAIPVTAESVAAAAVWMAGQPPSWSGNTLTLDEVHAAGGPAVAELADSPDELRRHLDGLDDGVPA